MILRRILALAGVVPEVEVKELRSRFSSALALTSQMARDLVKLRDDYEAARQALEVATDKVHDQATVIAERDLQIHELHEEQSALTSRLRLQSDRILELEHDLEEKTRELDRWLSIGYDRDTVERAAEQQLVIEGAPGGEPAKRARMDFNTVTQQGLWEIVRLSFREKNTWFFTDGGEQEFSAAILDPEFTKRVDARQFAFAHGDVIQAEREAQSWRDEDGKLHTKYRITKIHRVFNPDDNQLTFPAAAPAAATTEVSQ
jgi:hypothetical protein